MSDARTVHREPGIFLIDKPAGVSSARALAQLERRLSVPKLGHAGTLDPFATGLLVVLVNGATRCMELCLHGTKEYSGEIIFGAESTTDDCTGELTPTAADVPDEGAVREAAQSFIGVIDQVPPQVSAVHVDGERAYRRVRRGEVLQLRSRQVQVQSFTIAAIDHARYQFRIVCGPGTYIRSIARDLGRLLGCGGYLEALRRVRSSPFDVGSAAPPEAVEWSDLISLSQAFPQFIRYELTHAEHQRLCHGHIPVMALDREPCEKDLVVLVHPDDATEQALVRFVGNTWVFVFNSARPGELLVT